MAKRKMYFSTDDNIPLYQRQLFKDWKDSYTPQDAANAYVRAMLSCGIEAIDIIRSAIELEKDYKD